MTRARARAAAAITASLVVLVASPALGAPPPAPCAAAYENAQVLRQRGKLLEAHEATLTCARPECPEVARQDCAVWAAAIKRETPSLVVIVRDEDERDVDGARLFVDGAERAETSSGSPFELNPGVHLFRAEAPGREAVEQKGTVFQGERGRILRITLKRAAPRADSSVARARPEPVETPAAEPASRPSLTPAFVVAGLSVAALGTAAYLGITGRGELSDLRTSCSPACSDDDVDPVRRKLVASDVTLGVGLLGAAAAVYLFMRALPPKSARFDVAPTRGGAAFVLGGSF